jgi:hypothetical protein
MAKTKKTAHLTFKVISQMSGVPKSGKRTAFLVKDNWDDWGKYQTQFYLIVFDSSGVRHEPGAVKIAQLPKTIKEYWKTILPHQFTELDRSFFSLGQDESYYAKLMGIKNELRKQILRGLRDLALDQDSWNSIRNEPIVRESLLRFVKPRTVERQFCRILSGGARLTAYSLTYEGPKTRDEIRYG